MGILTIFSDPHLGCSRKANTTTTSRKLLKQRLVEAVEKVLESGDTTYCVGDFFDTFSNTEADLLVGIDLSKKVNVILAGNHDLANDSSLSSSLEVVKKACPTTSVYMIGVGEVGYSTKTFEDVVLVSIPHHSSQHYYEEALQQVYEAEFEPANKVLFLHCNYDYPEERLNATTLNLTEGDAKDLLAVFDYIIIGHGHTPSSHLGGKVLVVGSVFPTSFGDISDKRFLKLDTSNMSIESIPLWSKVGGYETLDVEDLLEPGEFDIPEECRFIDVTGAVSQADYGKFARALQTKLWGNSTGSNLIGVRNNTKVLLESSDVDEDEEASDSKVSLPDKVDAALQGTKYYKLWRTLLEECLESGVSDD